MFHITGDGECKRTQALPLTVNERAIHVVRFSNQPCTADFDHNQSSVFCGYSGWGDEEATVVCRNKLYSRYGIGGIIQPRIILDCAFFGDYLQRYGPTLLAPNCILGILLSMWVGLIVMQHSQAVILAMNYATKRLTFPQATYTLIHSRLVFRGSAVRGMRVN